MPATPPQSAIRAGRDRIQQARRAQRPANLTFDGGSPIAANAWISEETPEMTEGGWRRSQRLEATISKKLLTTRPTESTQIVHQASGLSFRVIEIYGDNATDVVWRVTAMRIITG